MYKMQARSILFPKEFDRPLITINAKNPGNNAPEGFKLVNPREKRVDVSLLDKLL